MEELVIGISVALIEITLEAKSRRAAERRLRGAKRVPDYQFSRNSREKEWYSKINTPTPTADITSTKDTMHENVCREVKENAGEDIKSTKDTMHENGCREVKENAGEDIKSCEGEDRNGTKETPVLAASTNNIDREEDTVMSSQLKQTDEDLIEPLGDTDATINKNNTKELVNKSAESALDVYKELRMRVLSARDRKMLREATELTEGDQSAPVTDEDHIIFVTDEDQSALVVFHSFH